MCSRPKPSHSFSTASHPSAAGMSHSQTHQFKPLGKHERMPTPMSERGEEEGFAQSWLTARCCLLQAPSCSLRSRLRALVPGALTIGTLQPPHSLTSEDRQRPPKPIADRISSSCCMNAAGSSQCSKSGWIFRRVNRVPKLGASWKLKYTACDIYLLKPESLVSAECFYRY